MKHDTRFGPRLAMACCFGLVLAAAAVWFCSVYPLSDGDYFWHCALGRDILRTGSIVHADRLSWLAGEQGLVYVDHSWLTDIFLYLLSTIGDTDLIGSTLYRALTGFVFGSIVFLFWGKVRVDLAGALACGAALFLSVFTVFENPRPQQISVILLVVTLKILQVLQEDPRSKTALLLPLAALAWANLHGGLLLLMLGFILMYFVLALVPDFRLGRAYHTRKGSAKVYGLLLAVCAAVGLANPYGVKIYQQYANVARACSVCTITEWQSPDADSFPILLLLLLLVALLLRRGDISLTGLAPVGAMAFLSLFHYRNVLWLYAVLAVCILQNGAGVSLPVFDRVPPKLQKGIFIVVYTGAAAAAVVIAALRFPAAITNDRPVRLSDELVQTLEAVRPTRLYTDINVGPNVIRAGIQDSFDCRVDLFTNEMLEDMEVLHPTRYTDTNSINAVLEKYGFDALLISKAGGFSLMASYFYEREDWTAVYDDGLYCLFLPASDTAGFLQAFMMRNGAEQDDGTVLEPVYLGTDITVHYADTKQVYDMVRNGERAVIWFGNPTDNACRAMLPELYEKLRGQGITELTVCDIERYKMVYGFDESGDLYTVQNRTEGYDELLTAFGGLLPDYLIEHPDAGEIDLEVKTIPPAFAVLLDDGTAAPF